MASSHTSEMFDAVTANAIDFLRESITRFSESPKQSVINFHAAIELFLKSRLLSEHWSLIVDKPENAVYSHFINGDFQSVSMEAAIKRLKNIANEDLPEAATRCFNEVRKHRNTLVHLSQKDYVGGNNPPALQKVVAEQCKAWFYLHQLLTVKWEEQFARFASGIGELNTLMHQHRGYLSVKFEQLHEEIQKSRSNGTAFSVCESCGFEAGERRAVLGSLFTVRCRVCGFEFPTLLFRCNACNSEVWIHQNMNEGLCKTCNGKVMREEVLARLSVLSGSEAMNAADSKPQRAHCAECAITPPTMVRYEGKWLCLNCLVLFDSWNVNHCGWCGEWVTGAVGDDCNPRCFMCGVHMMAEVMAEADDAADWHTDRINSYRF